MKNDRFDYLLFERPENEKEIEMKSKGFSFITNFTLEREDSYRRAAELHNIQYSFENEVYGRNVKFGDDGSKYKAFYVDSQVCDLSNFWNTVEELKQPTK